MTGPAGVMALVLAETLAGGIALAFLTPLWSEVKPGFFKVTGSIFVVTALATWGSVSAARVPGSVSGGWALTLSVLSLAATLLWVALLFARLPRAARVVGIASVVPSVGLLVVMAGTSGESFGLALFQLVAGAAFLGSVLDGLLLGHWYLTDRGLSRKPINRYALFLLIGVGLEFVAVIAGGFAPTSGSASFNPLLTAAGLAPWIAIGMVVVTAMIAIMIRLTLKGTRTSAVQSATGFFYLAVITAFAAELATKVRFLPGVS